MHSILQSRFTGASSRSVTRPGKLLRQSAQWLCCLALLCGTVVVADMAVADEAPSAQFMGDAVCGRCHATQYEAWQQSHHDLAMQTPNPNTVLGDFNEAVFEHYGERTEFRRRGEDFIVRTQGADGEMRDFTVAWVFGVYPLQQYLLPLDKGRLQALSVAWDTRPRAQGGQRWFHLYPDEPIPVDDPLHWTGSYQNWNSRCAECHSTAVEKRYDPETRSYSSRFALEDVSCEACHGAGRTHTELAGAAALENATNGGFAVDLKRRGVWQFDKNSPIAGLIGETNAQQIETCARCHARRGTLGDYQHGQALSTTHQLALITPPLYYPDGQIRDEVYVHGSFLQSRMYQAGVVCSDCHEPHSNALRAPGNQVCAQCHQPATYDTASHHRHNPSTAGSQCANCHMPATTYMGVDPRRDHGMRIPRPDLTVMLGSPNACNQCHTDQSAEWAVAALRAWGVQPRQTEQTRARAMQAASLGDRRAVPTLARIAADERQAPIWRASALAATSFASRDITDSAVPLLQAKDPLIRIGAIQALTALPPPERYALLAPLLEDPITGVRIELARHLADVPWAAVPAKAKDQLADLFGEYRATQRNHLDMPENAVALGTFELKQGQLGTAESLYRRALSLDRASLQARLNLADLLRQAGRDPEARQLLVDSLALYPGNANASHALGLLAIRQGETAEGVAHLATAAESANASARHRFVYAIALHDTGKPQQALAVLKSLHADLPADTDTLYALYNYSLELGDQAAARGYLRQLQMITPP